MAFALINARDLEEISKGDISTFEALLDKTIIPAVGEVFAAYCNRPDFDLKLRTEYFSPQTHQNILTVASPPIAEVGSYPDKADFDNTGAPAVRVWEDAALPRAYGSTTEIINGQDFFVYESAGQIAKECATFLRGHKTVKVVYPGGYLTADCQNVPGALKMAAIAQTKILFDRREEYGVTGRALEGGSINMLSVLTLPRQVTMLLDQFKVYRNAA